MTPSRIIAAFAYLALLGASTPAQRLAEAERAAAKSAQRIRQLDKAARDTSDEAENYRLRAAALAARVQQSEAALTAAEARVAVVDQTIASQRRDLAERHGRIVNLLAALESMSRRPPVLALIQPGSVRDTARVALLLDGVLPLIRRRTADLRQTIGVLRALRDRAAEAREELATAGQRLDDSRRLLARAEQRHREQARGLATESMLESDRALALSVEAKDLRQLIARLGSQAELRQRLASLPGPVLRPANIPEAALPPPAERMDDSAPAAPAARPGRFILPALGEVTTGFAELSQSGIRSRGISLKTRPRAQVVSPAAGMVAFAGPFREYGNIVIIEHEGGRTTLLAGLDKLDARLGERISAGGPVGRMGSGDGQLTIEVREQGEPVNPLPLMAGN